MVFKSRSTKTSARLYYSANSPFKITYASLARVVFLRVHTIYYVYPQATAVHEIYHGDSLEITLHMSSFAANPNFQMIKIYHYFLKSNIL